MAAMAHIDATFGNPLQPIACDDWAGIDLIGVDLQVGAPKRYQGAVFSDDTSNLHPEPHNHRRNHPVSPKKVNLVAALVRGMRVEDALLQLQVTVKRASKTVYQVIHSARANATHNHGLDADRLLIAEAFLGKGYFKKRVSYDSKGRSGIKMRPECRLTVVVQEITPEEEGKIARLRVSNFLKLTKRERQLVPHKLIEMTPIWNRKSKIRVPFFQMLIEKKSFCCMKA